MIQDVIRGLIYFVVLVLIQVLFLNHIHFLRMVTPFLYLYFLLKLPYDISRNNMLLIAFFTGLVIDAFTNTPGMHAAACTLAAFCREPLIRFWVGKDLPDGVYPSYRSFGFGNFFKYTLSFVLIHHTALFLIESFSLFDPLFLSLRILGSSVMTILLILAVEAFNVESQQSEDKR
ncbi:rod shape-determining protein MreD [Parabacteroides sp. PFB2-12]|uniref:rod shape-determining protein MreD n=1 Tax=unclassified Parabacteroides TaxID=2649774 RepID=UPI002475FAEC|nr:MULTISPECIES: rod shape-determining protein MreD [unclassified Parabacteroides]MDH6341282.1 rod shape-determining protein MreD [Parabacteroides sp. PM6-13]MDH6389074.1 rod shape-determining protein MreD [Parabacteroides sp. PFB2-12]